MTTFARHDRVVVTDANDTYAGQHGEVLDIHFGAVTGLAVVTVRLDEADRTDGFYAEQIDFERSRLRVAA